MSNGELSMNWLISPHLNFTKVETMAIYQTDQASAPTVTPALSSVVSNKNTLPVWSTHDLTSN